eukprot:3850130-Pleurochrysis_carterae.AAC.1
MGAGRRTQLRRGSCAPSGDGDAQVVARAHGKALAVRLVCTRMHFCARAYFSASRACGEARVRLGVHVRARAVSPHAFELTCGRAHQSG